MNIFGVLELTYDGLGNTLSRICISQTCVAEGGQIL